MSPPPPTPIPPGGAKRDERAHSPKWVVQFKQTERTKMTARTGTIKSEKRTKGAAETEQTNRTWANTKSNEGTGRADKTGPALALIMCVHTPRGR